MSTKKFPLLFSDLEVGTDEFGFIPRRDREDPDDEDFRYERYVKTVYRGKCRCIAGTLILEDV